MPQNASGFLYKEIIESSCGINGLFSSPPPGIVLILAGRSSAGIPPVICFPRFVCIRKKALPTDNTLVISLFCFGQQMEPSPPPISHSPAATWQTHSAIFRRSADFRSAFFHVHPSENSISTFKESISRKNGAPKRSVRAVFRKKTFSLFMRTNN